ncbi:MAG: efflux RND transporter periplasmic adaptor subunit [Coriobacteriia bacterium]|nr:efflux RND transporter periplasmic adaptor subunit [Coriobacteriia bacterium]
MSEPAEVPIEEVSHTIDEVAVIDEIPKVEEVQEKTVVEFVEPIAQVSAEDVRLVDDAPTAKRHNARRIFTWIISIGVLSLLAASAAWFYYDSQIPTIEVVEAERADLAIEVIGSGEIEPDSPTDVYSKQQGTVKKVHVTEGQKVAKGAKLLELDNEAFNTQLALAESALAQARAGLSQAQSGAISRADAIAAANRGVDAANAGLDTAYQLEWLAHNNVIDAQYFLDLLKTQPQPNPSEIAQAQSALEQAQIGHQQAVAGISAAEGSLAAATGALAQAEAGDPSGAIDAANAAIAACEEQVEFARKALEETIIKAPIAGVVLLAPTAATAQSLAAGGGTPTSGATLTEGSVVTPGMVLFTIMDPDRMLFTTQINDTDIARVSLEQSATVEIDSFPGVTFEGVVTKIAEQAQKTMIGATVFPVEILLEETKEKLAIGMKGEATIEVLTFEDVVTISRGALFSEGNNDYVYVVSEGRLVKTAVEIGEITDTTVEVRRALSSGERVALAGNIPYSDGMRVRTQIR